MAQIAFDALTVFLTMMTLYGLLAALSSLWVAFTLLRANRHWSREVGEMDEQWFIVVKYSPADWLGDRIDAYYVRTSSEALTLASHQHPLKPGECLRGFWVQDEFERQEAIELHDRRTALDKEWRELMEHIEDGWRQR